MKAKIAVVTGGNSGEYEISLKSGKNIADQLDRNKYDVYLIHLRGSQWTYKTDNDEIIPIDKNDFSLTLNGQHINFDCVFVAIHGDPGENGKLEGYLDMLNIPYTSCSTMVSALTFNKNYCNRVVNSYGITTAPSVHLFKYDHIDPQAVIDKVGLPCFVKPCNSGSSVGMSKVNTKEELLPALEIAFKEDDQLLVETFIKGREITCGIMKYQQEIQVIGITEIISKKEYFDFEAKYDPSLAYEITPAQIPVDIQELCEETSKKVYKALDCKGIVRIDYIFNDSGLYFIEVNTIPGQTQESIVPKQLKTKNLQFTTLCSYFIDEAIANKK
ncbi:MAG: D-alanine--D-alanine ligase [Bacteroidales bacterium]|nr:D-alanine--D-alanine ligase [Bacteroidales bacterium]